MKFVMLELKNKIWKFFGSNTYSIFFRKIFRNVFSVTKMPTMFGFDIECHVIRFKFVTWLDWILSQLWTASWPLEVLYLAVVSHVSANSASNYLFSAGNGPFPPVLKTLYRMMHKTHFSPRDDPCDLLSWKLTSSKFDGS